MKLAVEKLEAGYQGKTVVKDVSFTVEKGEFISLIGPSGCGKSTVLKVLAGLLEPMAGTIMVDDAPLQGGSRHFSYMPQSDLLLDWYDILDNVCLYGKIHGKKKEAQQQALEKNQSLISAMSHDIRNPLTALLGYLDLAKNGQYRSQEELQQYLDASYSKAEQLKMLTDELFRYSLVFGAQELPIQLESFDAAALLDQMVGEGIVMLEQKGYTIRRAVQPVSCQIQVDASYFKRVLDNLADNICKYADPAKPIHVLVAQESGALTLCVSNTILKNPGQVESNRIGLRICEKIMRQMGGTFEKRQTEDTFTVTLTLPTQPLAVEEGETS